MAEIHYIAYMDETGHAGDNAQRVCGMAGLVSTDDKWQILEEHWKGTLKRFNVPYMHMKEFGPSTGTFKSWKGDDSRGKAFYGELLGHLRNIRAIPFGSIYSLEVYRKLSTEDQQILNEPYLKSLTDCVGIPAFLLQEKSAEVKYNVVFSEQSEFKHRATKIYELFRAIYSIGERMPYPDFKDMRELIPLQAADVVAYELNREFGRQLYEPLKKPRYGYGQLLWMANKTLPFTPFFFYSEDHIRAFISQMKSEFAARAIATDNLSNAWKKFYAGKGVPLIDEKKRKRV